MASTVIPLSSSGAESCGLQNRQTLVIACVSAICGAVVGILISVIVCICRRRSRRRRLKNGRPLYQKMFANTSSSAQIPQVKKLNKQLTLNLANISHEYPSHLSSIGALTPVMKAQRDDVGSYLDPQELMGLCISSEQFDRRQRSRTPRSAPTEPVELPTQRFSWFSMIWGIERSISPDPREPSPPRGRSRESRLHTCRKVEDLRSEARRA
jgi:hypothetical protein